MYHAIFLWFMVVVLCKEVKAWDVGVATSSFQIEGGRDARSLTIWDEFCDTGMIADGSDADVACDSYDLYGEDVYWINRLGVKDYRLSFSWARLFVDGDVSRRNDRGFEYYHRVLDTLRQHHIRCHVTLFHWDLPSAFQHAYGGMLNSTRFRADYLAYTTAVLEEYGQKVQMWYTFNEPYTVAFMGFGKGAHAPGVNEPVRAPYQVGHTMLLAHADAWGVFRERRRLGVVRHDARMSIVLNSDFYYPKDPGSMADRMASDRAVWFRLGWFLSPMVTGDYPKIMKEVVGDRLPSFSAEERERVRGSFDVVALNYYTSMNVQDRPPASGMNFFTDPRVRYSKIPQSIPSASSWLFLYPQGLLGLVSWAVHNFPSLHSIEFQITENGISTLSTAEDDVLRIQCMNETFGVVDAIHRRKIANVSAFFIWSLMDNFEWDRGYTESYGLLRVDFDNPARPRTPRRSFEWLQQYVSGNKGVQN